MKTVGNISRRSILAASAITIAAPRIGYAKSEEITFAGFGGLYQAAQTKALFDPFTQETGIKIKQTTDDIDLTTLQQQVRTRRAPSLLSMPDRLILSAVDDGLLAPLDYNIIDARDIGNNLVQQYYVGSVIFAMMLTTRKFLNPTPKNWQDFWDIKRFPGQHGFYDYPTYSLEFALLADGVDRHNLYPLDLDRAFNSLDKIKSEITWWNSFSAPGFLFDTGHLDMTPWSRGIAMIISEKPLNVFYDGAAFTFEAWCVPNNTENPEASMKFINWALQPERQAALAKYIAFSPTNTKAMAMIEPNLQSYLPTYPGNLEKGFFLSGEWWRQNLGVTTSRWRRWRNR